MKRIETRIELKLEGLTLVDSEAIRDALVACNVDVIDQDGVLIGDGMRLDNAARRQYFLSRHIAFLRRGRGDSWRPTDCPGKLAKRFVETALMCGWFQKRRAA